MNSRPPRTGRDLDGRVGLVTGAGSGIGSGIAEALAEAGATVAVNDVDSTAAAATVEALRATGATADPFVADISVEADASRMIAAVVARYGRLDILVNNAGVTGTHTVEEMPNDEWERLIAINLNGPFYAIRSAIPHLKQSGNGRIVCISSVAGIRVSRRGGAAYTTTKAALLGLTRHAASELARYGITANAVLPGPVSTPLSARVISEDEYEQAVAVVPAGRFGTVAEVGQLVAFLASESAGYINGAEIPIDGGQTTL
jgi:NAD(P)-dependent dehydrogenase (short-subunit alcohol dehydrogenase family)